MQSKFTVLLALATTGLAQTVVQLAKSVIDSSDVPETCLLPCHNAIVLSSSCSTNTNSTSGYNDCICNDTLAHVELLQCNSCISSANETDIDLETQMVTCGFIASTTQSSTNSTGSDSDDSDSAASYASISHGSMIAALFVGFAVLL
ncbi:uncharacterized protein BCR38DRAFT_527846 [Pseudomassariella vexata]|uniref:Extracellular membrane protein CFEM domain-containing protein n=1 Tax=Pseudomassariella vexata TaxID=1141098 RepID=A0A1Y2DEY6_9PEZI|nr:uncharacterized protein BCR38DRAFT_527846 [Pseudomassariella vexata]ORY57828.1 hypothetical protein BCR38DRAFT_527846 [Pseudomassariella vexata]